MPRSRTGAMAEVFGEVVEANGSKTHTSGH